MPANRRPSILIDEPREANAADTEAGAGAAVGGVPFPPGVLVPFPPGTWAKAVNGIRTRATTANTMATRAIYLCAIIGVSPCWS